MELFIRRGAEFERLYNCSFYNVSDIPLEKRQNIPIGALIFTVSFMEEGIFYSRNINDAIKHWINFQVLYVPCMFAMWKHMEFTCYKIMFCKWFGCVCFEHHLVKTWAFLTCSILSFFAWLTGFCQCSGRFIAVLLTSYTLKDPWWWVWLVKSQLSNIQFKLKAYGWLNRVLK